MGLAVGANIIRSAKKISLVPSARLGKLMVALIALLFVDEIKLINKMQTIGENLLARAKLSIKPRWPFI